MNWAHGWQAWESRTKDPLSQTVGRMDTESEWVREEDKGMRGEKGRGRRRRKKKRRRADQEAKGARDGTRKRAEQNREENRGEKRHRKKEKKKRRKEPPLTSLPCLPPEDSETRRFCPLCLREKGAVVCVCV